MITKEMIERINQLSEKSREAGLTEEEQQEQKELRKKYIECIKDQVRHQLEHDCGHHHHDCDCGCNYKK
ncbi:MAG: DUF896 domain-containing protein [Clostridiaceae bacterium]|nr:DUF896 domain-containing protein [Clostridiaceae bacterium]